MASLCHFEDNFWYATQQRKVEKKCSFFHAFFLEVCIVLLCCIKNAAV